MPFVGRTEELAALRDAFEAASDGEVVVVMVAGDPGRGKTALTEHFTRGLVGEGVPVHWGRCAEVGGAPVFWPWIQILRSMGDDVLAAAQERFDTRADEPYAAFDAVHEELRARRDRPQVLVLDDVHAADLPSLELLRFLARTATGFPLLVIATHRLSELRNDPARDVLLAAVGAPARRLTPGALGLDEVRVLLDGRVPDAVLDQVAEDLLERSAGNALYVEQLVDAVSRDGPGVLAEIPDGIRAAVRSRLGPLSAFTVELLCAASILGAGLRGPLLAAMSGGTIDEVEAAIDEAMAVGVLVEVDGEVVFDHALVRDAVADSLSPRRRRSLHAAAAEAWSQVTTRGTGRAPSAVVAQHLLDAGDLADPAEVAQWCDAAAADAGALGGHAEAGRWFALAARHWGEAGDPTRQGRALKAGARSRVIGGDALGALALSEELAQLARRVDSGVLLAEAALAHADVFQPSQGLDTPPRLLEALGHPDLVAEPLLRSELLAATAALLGMPGDAGPRTDPAGARQAIAELEALAAEGDPRIRAHLADARLNVDSGPAHHDDRRTWLAQLDEVLPAGPAIFDRLNRVYWATSLAFEAGDLHEVERRTREWSALADRAESSYWRWRGAMARASLAYARGRLDLCEQVAAAAQPLVATMNPGMGLRVLGGMVFTIRRDQGRLGELATHGPDAFGALGALISVELGDRADARRRLDQVARLADGTGPDDLYWLCLQSILAYGGDATGDVERSQQAARELAPYVDQCVMWGRSYVFGGPVAEALGVAHRGAGDRGEAAAAFRRSIEWADGVGAPGFGVRGRVGLASVLDPGDDERAELLDAAIRSGDGFGQHRAVAAARALAALAVGRPGVGAAARPGADAPVSVSVSDVGVHATEVPDAPPASPLPRGLLVGSSRAEVRVLGRFEVVGVRGTEPSRWSSRKARDALKLLIAGRGRAIPREELMDRLWPDVEVATARGRLSVVLSMVRAALDPAKVLDGDPLRADRQSVSLDLDLVSVDVEAFFQAAAATASLVIGRPGQDELVARLQDAAELAGRGPFLAEDPYVDWAAGARAAVERTHREVLRTLARHAQAQDEDAASGWWARLVELDPDDAAARGSLLGLLEATGRHGEAATRRREDDERRRSLGLGPRPGSG